jgi:hypothetical protein
MTVAKPSQYYFGTVLLFSMGLNQNLLKTLPESNIKKHLIENGYETTATCIPEKLIKYCGKTVNRRLVYQYLIPVNLAYSILAKHNWYSYCSFVNCAR